VLHVYCSTIYNSQVKESKYLSRDEQMKKVITCTVKYYSAMKRSVCLFSATTWMYFKDIRLSEINQAQEDKYPALSLICGI
jgi:hypothetical protein